MTHWYVNEGDSLINEHLTECAGRYTIHDVWYLVSHLWHTPINDESEKKAYYNALLLTSYGKEQHRHLLTFSSRALFVS